MVNVLYRRVLADPQLVGGFEGTYLVWLKCHQVQLVSQVPGGPVSYQGPELAAAHNGRGISEADLDEVGDEVPLFFYSHLFLSHPEVRQMFPVSMAAQRTSWSVLSAQSSATPPSSTRSSRSCSSSDATTGASLSSRSTTRPSERPSWPPCSTS